MLIGWFLSMWLSNTATTAMLMPIAIAVASEFDPEQKDQTSADDHELMEKDDAINGVDSHQCASDEVSSDPPATDLHL